MCVCLYTCMHMGAFMCVYVFLTTCACCPCGQILGVVIDAIVALFHNCIAAPVYLCSSCSCCCTCKCVVSSCVDCHSVVLNHRYLLYCITVRHLLQCTVQTRHNQEEKMDPSDKVPPNPTPSTRRTPLPHPTGVTEYSAAVMQKALNSAERQTSVLLFCLFRF